MLRRISTILIATLLFSLAASAQSFGTYKGLGASVGAEYMFRGWNASFEGMKPSHTLITADFEVFFLFVGVDFFVKNTGHDIYGFNESIGSQHIKIGAALQYITPNDRKFVFCPYVGFGSWSVRDSSGNDIGARTSYAERGKFTSVGVKALYKLSNLPLSIGLDLSTRTAGVSFGFLL